MTSGTVPTIEEICASVLPLDGGAMEAARDRQGRLTKPPGSLGRLEAVAIRLAGIQGGERPSASRRAVLVAAADHGVTAEGVSAYPASVTGQMVANFLGGGAAVNALARAAGARVIVADFGVAGGTPPGVVDAAVRRVTGNMAVEAAMTREEAGAAIGLGYALARREAAAGLDLLALGEMGIGNTTAAAALTSALTGAPPRQTTGRGTGIDDDAWERKVAVVERALVLHRPGPGDPLGALAAVGGLEIAGLAGAAIGAAASRAAVVVDGFISGAAALVAARICPAVLDYLFASHLSPEPGHRLQLEALGLVPMLHLDMRLGEGTGAVLAMQIIGGAVAAHNEMATFAEAGVEGRVNGEE